MIELGPKNFINEPQLHSGKFIPLWPKAVLPEGHPFVSRDICAMTGLSMDNVKAVVGKRLNRGQPPLVQPLQTRLSHRLTNTFSPENLVVFNEIYKLMEGGRKLGEAIDFLREQLLIEQAQGLDKS